MTDHTRETVYLLEDDDAVRRSITRLLQTAALDVEEYAEPVTFLKTLPSDAAGCLILDVRMPHMSGLQVLEHLRDRQIFLPTVFISGCADLPMVVQAMKLGAVDFLEKPFSEQNLLDRIHESMNKYRRHRQRQNFVYSIRNRMEDLTEREQTVLDHLVQGENTKTIAHALNVSPKTIEFHRVNVLRKMQADSVVELVRQVLAVQAADEASRTDFDATQRVSSAYHVA